MNNELTQSSIDQFPKYELIQQLISIFPDPPSQADDHTPFNRYLWLLEDGDERSDLKCMACDTLGTMGEDMSCTACLIIVDGFNICWESETIFEGVCYCGCEPDDECCVMNE